MAKNIYIVEDEPDIREALAYNFKKEGFNTIEFSNGEDCLQEINKKKPDVLILDIMLPGISGLDVCREIRSDEALSNIAIIMLTAKGEEIDRIVGFELGADDYVTKPFSINELLARAKAVIKRARPIFAEEQITFCDISLNIATHKVFREDKEIKLGPTEFNLLRFFLENIDRVFSRDQLLNHVWKNDALVEPRTVDVHVRRLRKVLNTNNKKDYIRTVRSAGYSFGHN